MPYPQALNRPKSKISESDDNLLEAFKKVTGGDTSIPREASKEATKHYNLRRNARIWCHPYEVNNMLILMKKFKNLSLEDIYISKDFEDMKRSKPMKMRAPPLNP